MPDQEAAETEDCFQENKKKKKKEDRKSRNYQADPIAVMLLSDVAKQYSFSRRRDADADSRKNEGNKEENQKPINGMEDFQNPLKKTSSRSPRISAPLPIEDSVTTLKNQNSPRQKPEESYTRRLLSDVETQIGFFKGAVFYNEKNKKYPFLDSKSMKEFIANWLQVDVSDTNLIEVVKQLKLHYKRKLVEIEGKLDCLDPDKERAFDWAHNIWGNPEKLVLRRSVYEVGECSTKCQNDDDYGDDDQGAVKKIKKNHEIPVPYNIKISILNGIIDYKQVVGRTPFHTYGDLISFKTSWIPLKVPVETLISWTHNLMIEYKEVRERARATDTFKSAEEQEFYQLGHQLWGRR